MNHTTRESWLNAAMDELKPLFEREELRLPPVIRASVGLCGGKAIGLCVFPECAADGSSNIFVDPKLDDPLEIIGVVLHEMAHAHCHSEGHEGHKGKFVKVIRALGLAGKATHTFIEPGTELHAKCQAIVVKLGPYPHAPVVKRKKETKKHPWIPFRSEDNEEFVVRCNKNTVKELGAPRDPWGKPMVPKNPEDMEDDDDNEDGSEDSE